MFLNAPTPKEILYSPSVKFSYTSGVEKAIFALKSLVILA